MIPDWASERREMVETQLRRRGISDGRVLAAMDEIPREEFVPPESRIEAYTDGPIRLGYGQTISQPYMTVARPHRRGNGAGNRRRLWICIGGDGPTGGTCGGR
jgi:hypothetical protein